MLKKIFVREPFAQRHTPDDADRAARHRSCKQETPVLVEWILARQLRPLRIAQASPQLLRNEHLKLNVKIVPVPIDVRMLCEGLQRYGVHHLNSIVMPPIDRALVGEFTSQ